MDPLAKKLDAKLREWKPEVAEQVRQRVAELIDLADRDLPVAGSGTAEEESQDLID